MTQVEFTTQVLARGRATKFTPERIQQIKNLVERGKSREEIADLVGVTVASLQVTCSRLGVSLRRPIFNTGTGLLRRAAPGPNGTANHHADDASKGVILQSTKERPEQNSESAPVEQAQTPTPHQEREKRMNEVGLANFAICGRNLHFRYQDPDGPPRATLATACLTLIGGSPDPFEPFPETPRGNGNSGADYRCRLETHFRIPRFRPSAYRSRLARSFP
jgi:hypothetical protein